MYLFENIWRLADLTLLDGWRSGAVSVVVPLLRRVVAVLWHCVGGRTPLLVAVVTLSELGGGGALRLTELQLDPAVLLLHLTDPRLQDSTLQHRRGGRVRQTGRQKEGAAI